MCLISLCQRAKRRIIRKSVLPSCWIQQSYLTGPLKDFSHCCKNPMNGFKKINRHKSVISNILIDDGMVETSFGSERMLDCLLS
jgi:hypothetical protein